MTTLANIRLAAAPTTWGVDFADNPRNPAWNRVLDEIEACNVDADARKRGVSPWIGALLIEQDFRYRVFTGSESMFVPGGA